MHVFRSCSNVAHCMEPSPLAAQQFKRDDMRTKHLLVGFLELFFLKVKRGNTGKVFVWTSFLLTMIDVVVDSVEKRLDLVCKDWMNTPCTLKEVVNYYSQ